MLAHVEADRAQEVGKLRFFAMERDAGERLLVDVARLKAELRQCCCEVHVVLAAPARDGEDRSALRKNSAEDLEDRLAIALRSRRVALRHAPP